MRSRKISACIGTAVSVAVAFVLFVFIDIDRCADAGGSYSISALTCYTPIGSGYVPLLFRPQIGALLVFLSLLASVPGYISYSLARRLMA